MKVCSSNIFSLNLNSWLWEIVFVYFFSLLLRIKTINFVSVAKNSTKKHRMSLFKKHFQQIFNRLHQFLRGVNCYSAIFFENYIKIISILLTLARFQHVQDWQIAVYLIFATMDTVFQIILVWTSTVNKLVVLSSLLTRLSFQRSFINSGRPKWRNFKKIFVSFCCRVCLYRVLLAHYASWLWNCSLLHHFVLPCTSSACVRSSFKSAYFGLPLGLVQNYRSCQFRHSMHYKLQATRSATLYWLEILNNWWEVPMKSMLFKCKQKVIFKFVSS